jgi:hypothetical protein
MPAPLPMDLGVLDPRSFELMLRCYYPHLPLPFGLQVSYRALSTHPRDEVLRALAPYTPYVPNFGGGWFYASVRLY